MITRSSPATTASSTSSIISTLSSRSSTRSLVLGGLDGSIMFWVFLLSIFGSTAVYVNRERHRELIPYVVAIISMVEISCS